MIAHRLPRRTFLRAAGVCIGLPLLDAMLPVGLRAEQRAEALSPRRMVLIGRPLGMHSPFFFPEKPGRDYEPSRYLKSLADLRDDFTVLSGVSHRGYPGGHGTSAGLITGVAPEGIRPGDLRNTISLDQEVASRMGNETRYASLVLGGGGDLSWNRKGIKVPAEGSVVKVFKQLFVDGTPDEVTREIQRIQNGESILDGVRQQARTLAKRLSPTDRDRIDLLLSSIREAEQRLQQDQQWILKPKPKVAAKVPASDYITGGQMLERTRQWFDIVHLALQTDSTRVVSLFLWSHENVQIDGQMIGHHDASHHGQDEEKIKRLATIEEAEVKLFAELLGKLKASREGGPSLLDRTQLFYGSNLGNASAHTCDNLPILVAGGGLKHAGHLAFDRKDNYPLSNLFVRMLQQMGLEQDRFGSSTGVLSEI